MSSLQNEIMVEHALVEFMEHNSTLQVIACNTASHKVLGKPGGTSSQRAPWCMLQDHFTCAIHLCNIQCNASHTVVHEIVGQWANCMYVDRLHSTLSLLERVCPF